MSGADEACNVCHVVCDYCHKMAEQVSGRVMYPHRPELATKVFYRCGPCKAHVGCHPGTITPLGRLADSKLRLMKQRTHAAFDPLWQNRLMSRKQAYSWLGEKLQLDRHKVHIGMFDVLTCERAIAACKDYHNHQQASVNHEQANLVYPDRSRFPADTVPAQLHLRRKPGDD